MDFLAGFGSYYANVTNTIVKISPINGMKKPALLLNCHTDSVVGVPGELMCKTLLKYFSAVQAIRESLAK